MRAKRTIHELLVETFAGYVGQEFETSQILTMMEGKAKRSAILPNDHASGNKHPCWCARTDKAIFEQVRRGLYRVR